MDYNSSREKLILPEYGRNIQKMVDFLITIEDRDERNKQAKAVVAVMGNLFPHLRDVNDFKHKIWDHLAIISDFRLDIDYPYEIPQREMFVDKPKKVPYKNNGIKHRYYGRIVEDMIAKAIEFEEGDEKELLIRTLANHMKKVYLLWNKETVEDEQIINDIKRLSNGKLSLPEGTELTDKKALVPKNKKPQNKKQDHKRHQNKNDKRRNFKR